MYQYSITGGRRLEGELTIQGSKNGILPILAATVLHKGTCVIHGCPHITDVFHTLTILNKLGCKTVLKNHTVIVDSSQILVPEIHKEDSEKMRSSIIFMGSLLGRCGECRLWYPGGCTIGRRPIDIHEKGLRKLGAQIEKQETGIFAKTKTLRGGEYHLPFPSVGATENLILASVLADGITVLTNVAQEPEILELCNFLNCMGADIRIRESQIVICGVRTLRDVEYTLSSDRIVTGTYLLAVMGTTGKITIRRPVSNQLESLFGVIRQMGGAIECRTDALTVSCDKIISPVSKVETGPYPAFPTDLQSPLLAVLTKANGMSRMRERMFEERYKIVPYLQRMGADIRIADGEAFILGGGGLKGKMVIGEELRGTAALIIAGLMAEGETIVKEKGFLERGYEDMARDLQKLGAKIAYEKKWNERN